MDASVHAGITLLAPQAALDQRPPEVNLDSTLRIPLYQKVTYNFSDIISDTSHYSVSIDGDVTQDESKDGIFDDDFALDGTGFDVSTGSIAF